MESTRQPHGYPPWLMPTITKQSWLFMIGSTLFAIGPALSIWKLGSAQTTNFVCFIGAWFFTTAGLVQWVLAGDATVKVPGSPAKVFRADWLAAFSQSLGTVLFNVSTTAALTATTVKAQHKLVWSPDAGGSVAFLVSACFVLVAYTHRSKFWEPSKLSWWVSWINMAGCIAFGISAVGAFIEPDGSTADAFVANWGTFIGAICFFLASFLVLPKLPWNRTKEPSIVGSPTPQLT